MTGTGGDEPRLSVIVTTWEAASTVERCLTSILDETRVPLECVVVDDGSSDGTAALVERMADRDPRVVLDRLAVNGGVSVARNRALQLARGAWLTFVDADDRLLPGAIAALMAPTDDPSVRCVVGQRIWTNGSRTWISKFYDLPDIREPGRKSLLRDPGLVYYASVTGKVFERALLEGIAFEGRVLGDQQVAIRAMLRAGDGIEVIATDVYEWARSPKDRFVPTLTNTTRRTADRLTVAAPLAARAFEQVAAEVDATVHDEAARRVVKRAYAERLVRSDFSRALAAAIDRGDPGLAPLFGGLTTLLRAFPPTVLEGSAVIISAVLRPPWVHWARLDAAARRSYWRMLEPVRAVDPSVDARVVGSRYLVPAFHLARLVTGLHPRAGGVVVRAIHGLERRRRSRRGR